jgi:AraC-like DNA-binding protein
MLEEGGMRKKAREVDREAMNRARDDERAPGAAPESGRPSLWQILRGRGADPAGGDSGGVPRIPSPYKGWFDEHLAFRRAVLFRELLQADRVLAPQEWREELIRLNLPPHREPYCVAIAEVDGYGRLAERHSPRDRQLLKYALAKAASELADGTRFAIWPEWLDSSRLGLLFLKARFGFVRLEDAAAVCDRLRAWAESHLGFTVTIGVGDPAADARRIAESSRQADEALRRKLVRGTNRLILYREIRAARKASPLSDCLAEVRKFAGLFRKGEPEWRDAFHRLFGNERLADLTRDDAVTLVNVLAVALGRMMAELAPAESAGWRTTRAEPALRRIAGEMESLAEARDALFGILLECEEQWKRMRGSRPLVSLFEQIRQYIDRNYANPDLSLVHLGGRFGLPPKSVSHLFKEHSGVNFVDYLADVRMEQAKRLLVASDDPISDVAAKVGYVHAVSFNRVFKKLVGLTPGKFRRRHRSNGNAFSEINLYTSIQEPRLL